MKEENLQISLLEKQILHCFMDNPNLIDEDLDCFVSPQGLELYMDILSLKEEGKNIIPEHILTMDNEFITSDILISVQNTEYQIDCLEEYKQKLNKKFILYDFRTKTLDILNDDDTDDEKIESISEEFDFAKNNLKKDDKEKEYLDINDLLEEYKGEIEKRSKGIRNLLGDYNLEKLIPNPQGGIGLIVGMSGSMKSTFIIKLLRNRITKRLPTCAINTELTHATYMDTLTSTMIDEKYDDLVGDTDDSDIIDWDKIISKLDELQKHYKDKKKLFYFYRKNNAKISEIKKFIIHCRKKMGLKKDDLLLCTIDLLLMIEDMNDPKLSRADAITQGLNKLNDIGLELNTLFLGTIQSRRLQNKVQINDISDLDKFRISTEMLKESGSLEERSRFILAVHNPKYLVNKNPCSQVIRDLVDPILELTVIKNTWKSNLGQTIYYYIDSDHKDLVDYEPPEGEIPNSYSVSNDNTEKDDSVEKIESQLKDVD